MAINPIAFARTVNEQFLRYQLTAFPIADEALARQAEESIRGIGARPTPLIKGPYLSLEGIPGTPYGTGQGGWVVCEWPGGLAKREPGRALRTRWIGRTWGAEDPWVRGATGCGGGSRLRS